MFLFLVTYILTIVSLTSVVTICLNDSDLGFEIAEAE